MLRTAVFPVEEAAGQPLDQVFIGSCTNGRLSDLRTAAEVVGGRKVNRGTGLIVVPGSPEVLQGALREGLVERFVEAGGVVMPPGSRALCRSSLRRAG